MFSPQISHWSKKEKKVAKRERKKAQETTQTVSLMVSLVEFFLLEGWEKKERCRRKSRYSIFLSFANEITELYE